MNYFTRAVSPAMLVTVALSACASFEPKLRMDDLSRNRVPTASDTRNGLEVSIEEFVSANKSQTAFDADVAGNGVMAILIRVENRSTNDYRLPRAQLTAWLAGERLARLDGKEAGNQGAGKEYGGRALGWTLATGPFALLLAPVTLVGSSAHTASVNKTIEEHFGTMEIPDALLKQNQSVAGFAYFKLPFGLTRLENAVVEIQPVDDVSEEKHSFKFPLPVVSIVLPTSRGARGNNEN